LKENERQSEIIVYQFFSLPAEEKEKSGEIYSDTVVTGMSHQMIHQTTVIDKGAVIEENSEIVSYMVIYSDTIIKAGLKYTGNLLLNMFR
jgi:UDP-3-O-[3-hydroxymyristoyl] glucosamine N-acyltransferase